MAHHSRYRRKLTSPNRQRYFTRLFVGTSLLTIEGNRRLPNMQFASYPLSIGDIATDGVNVSIHDDGEVTTAWVVD